MLLHQRLDRIDEGVRVVMLGEEPDVFLVQLRQSHRVVLGLDFREVRLRALRELAEEALSWRSRIFGDSLHMFLGELADDLNSVEFH